MDLLCVSLAGKACGSITSNFFVQDNFPTNYHVHFSMEYEVLTILVNQFLDLLLDSCAS